MNFGHLFRKKTLSEKGLEKQYGRTWIWTALDAQSRLLICFHIDERTLEECRKFFKMLMKRIKNKPLFTSDELPHYKDAILEEFHQEVKFKKTGERGRPKNPLKKIDPEIENIESVRSQDVFKARNGQWDRYVKLQAKMNIVVWTKANTSEYFP